MWVRYEADFVNTEPKYLSVPTEFSRKLPFLITDCGHYRSGARYFTEREGHESCLLLLTLEGEGFLNYEGREYALKPDSVMLIDCRKHQFYQTVRAPWRFKFFHFWGTSAADMASLLLETGAAVVAAPGIAPEYAAVERCCPSDTLEKALEASAAMHRLLYAVYRASRATATAAGRKAMEQAAETMRLHCAEPLSLDELSKSVFLSKYHFVRSFKRYSGMPPHEYLRNLRLARAKTLLRETSDSVENIALSCGFASASHLIRRFKKTAGMTPHKYRTQI